MVSHAHQLTKPHSQLHACIYIYRDLEKLELPVYSVKAHESIINAIDGVGGLGIGGGAPEILTGSRDGEANKICKN